MIRAALALLLCWGVAAGANAADHGVILIYHRVTEDGPASTRVSPTRFREHLDWLDSHGFSVLPLSRLLDDLYELGETRENAVAITFDDAYASVYQAAFPLLRERDMPFSVFVATDAVDKGYSHFMNWEQLAEMQASGLVEIGPHSLSHAHLEQRKPGETGSDWRQRVSAEIKESAERLAAKLPEPPIPVFAYPFGEYSAATLELVAEAGMRGLAQQSGAFGPAVPARRIPRFAMATGYDALDRLATAVRSRPLPVEREQAQPFFLQAGQEHPGSLTLTLQQGAVAPGAVNCFSSSGGALETAAQGSELTVTLPPFTAGRNKVNCTAGTGTAGEFYWYSRIWTVADGEGQWLNE
ncbi:polysaccharide deacetylase family protein [Parahaliea maris]|uniref:Polysaccharide deacetylase family protein n=1 Tax=Parahaliea maris TaxID=2716870 RepID=A0A5C8ZTS9_9GAMM|nr:polysaccharide deacetylase family protein [Parahaliea maris]TXS91898.1 polysaccharide deacetylase family protein [Parahaliea maris]